MALLKLSRIIKSVYDSLLSLMVNGWMSGSYTGAVLTEEYYSVSVVPAADSRMRGSDSQLELI